MKRLKQIIAILRKIAPSTEPGQLKIMAICFCSAFVLWILTALQKEDHQMTVKVPLEYDYDQSRLSVMDPLPEYVNVDVSGPGWGLVKLYLPYLRNRIAIDLPDDASRKYATSREISSDVREALSGLRVGFISPDTIKFDIDRKIRKKVKVGLNPVSVNLAEGFRVFSEVEAFPDSIVIEGPEKQILAAPDEFLVDLPMETVEGPVNTNIDLTVEETPYLNIFPSKVRVKFDVDEMVTVNYPVNMEIKHFPSDGSAFLLDSVTYIQYNIRKKEKALHLPFRVGVDFLRLNLSDSTIMPEVLSIPKQVENVHLDSGAVKVHFKEKDEG
ncbi:hypothetical protein [Persicobacter diffluens]|uniref:YbbR-like domain-containing protein n=1 Tax=Persicobacter diffluens TaxID=981 RepID=A0AAN4VUM0_9BACT|nr:hypothetical protein PEDI_02440 [Persicobacter diffluens]